VDGGFLAVPREVATVHTVRDWLQPLKGAYPNVEVTLAMYDGGYFKAVNDFLVCTEDGAELARGVSFNLRPEFSQEQSLEIRYGSAPILAQWRRCLVRGQEFSYSQDIRDYLLSDSREVEKDAGFCLVKEVEASGSGTFLDPKHFVRYYYTNKAVHVKYWKKGNLVAVANCAEPFEGQESFPVHVMAYRDQLDQELENKQHMNVPAMSLVKVNEVESSELLQVAEVKDVRWGLRQFLLQYNLLGFLYDIQGRARPGSRLTEFIGEDPFA
jgi:hypothetical protein